MGTISENIKILRENRKWSKSEMATRLNLKHYTTITKWENGENYPLGREIVKLCNLFNVSSDELLGLKELNLFKIYNYYQFVTEEQMKEFFITGSVAEEKKQWVAISDAFLGDYANNERIVFCDLKHVKIGVLLHDEQTQIEDGKSVLTFDNDAFKVASFDSEHEIKSYGKVILSIFDVKHKV